MTEVGSEGRTIWLLRPSRTTLSATSSRGPSLAASSSGSGLSATEGGNTATCGAGGPRTRASWRPGKGVRFSTELIGDVRAALVAAEDLLENEDL